MAIPLVIPIVVKVAIGVSVSGGILAYLGLSDSDIEDVVDALRTKGHSLKDGITTIGYKSEEYKALERIYFDNYPSHNDDMFQGYLEAYVMNVVWMRSQGILEYADYTTPTKAAIDKVKATYVNQTPAPPSLLITQTFFLLIQGAWETADGKKHLMNAEHETIIEKMRNAFQQMVTNKNTEFEADGTIKWKDENASVEGINMDLGLPSVNTLLLAGFGLAALFVVTRR